MTLGEYIKQYRMKQKISMREFARRSDLSNGYVSMLESGKDGRGNKIVPSLETINKVAKTCGKDFATVFDALDLDYTITTGIGSHEVDEESRILMEKFSGLSESDKIVILKMMDVLLRKEE